MNRYVVFSSILTAIILFLSNPVLGQTDSADDTVRSTTTVVIERIIAERDKIASDPEYIYVLMDELVVPKFDFLCPGQFWEQHGEMLLRTNKQLFLMSLKIY